MKNVKHCLNGMKSRCFMLFACLALMAGLASCSEDYFEDNLPEKSKQFSKAELIERALSRMPQTRAADPFPVMMVTTNEVVSITFHVTESVTIYWGDGEKTIRYSWASSDETHTYHDNEPVHAIYLEASNEAIETLWVDRAGLIFLNVANNTNLSQLLCTENDLDYLDLTGCPNLQIIMASVNNLSSIDLTHLPHLNYLSLGENQFTDIDVSKNPELQTLYLYRNPIIDLDLTKNTALERLSLESVPIQTINNLPIGGKCFAMNSNLKDINIASTSFTSLDLSDNPLVTSINIFASSVTQLDISQLQIVSLSARYSQLTNLKYTLNNLTPFCEYIDIVNTPFEKNRTNVYSLIASLPNRNEPNKSGYIQQGRLGTTSLEYVTPFLTPLKDKNWVVFQ
ncbi:MAG: hypothetical protein K2I90_05995 [Odoribacter sp.]|nr:hypothetical protein [Odoribacter sp.]